MMQEISIWSGYTFKNSLSDNVKSSQTTNKDHPVPLSPYTLLQWTK